MSDTENSRYLPDLYWKRLGQLKAAAICMRLYRNRLAVYVRCVEMVKALASCGAIAVWAVWKDYPLVWAAIIAASQVLDATKHVFPFARSHRSASELTVALELLCIDSEVEWQSIYAGKVPDHDISERWARLGRLQLQVEHKHFPDGFNPPRSMVDMANRQANDYLLSVFGEE